MVFKASNPDIKAIIDYFRTGKYGEEEYPDKVYCSHCGAIIFRNSSCYFVKEKFYCMDCSGVAEESILDNYRDRFLYTL